MDTSNYTFERCPHDKENPYVILNRHLIRDTNVSPECRFLLMYLLSHGEKWQIRVSQLKEHFKTYWGRDKVYKLISEGILAGYIKRITFVRKGPKGTNQKAYKYYISESPKFKQNPPD